MCRLFLAWRGREEGSVCPAGERGIYVRGARFQFTLHNFPTRKKEKKRGGRPALSESMGGRERLHGGDRGRRKVFQTCVFLAKYFSFSASFFRPTLPFLFLGGGGGEIEVGRTRYIFWPGTSPSAAMLGAVDKAPPISRFLFCRFLVSYFSLFLSLRPAA